MPKRKSKEERLRQVEKARQAYSSKRPKVLNDMEPSHSSIATQVLNHTSDVQNSSAEPWVFPASPEFPQSNRFEAVLSFKDKDGKLHAMVIAKHLRVFVCSCCREVVHRPVSHMLRKHDMQVPEEVFNSIETAGDEWYVDCTEVIDAIPFVRVERGFSCSECKRCFLLAKNISHLESCSKTAPIQEVKIQRVVGNGVALTAIPVRDVERAFSFDGAEHDLDQILTLATAEVNRISDFSEREVNPFYKNICAFLSAQDIEEFRLQRLHELFDDPKGVHSGWKSAIYKIFLSTFAWADGLDPALKTIAWYRTIGRSAKNSYIRAFVKIINFQVNMSSRGSIRTPLMLSYPFHEYVTRVVQGLSHETLFSLIEKLMSQPIGLESKTVIDGMIRLYCVDPRDFTLRDPRYIQPFVTHVMRLFQLTLLASSALASGVKFPAVEEQVQGCELDSESDSGNEEGAGQRLPGMLDGLCTAETKLGDFGDVLDKSASPGVEAFTEELQSRRRLVDIEQMLPIRQVVNFFKQARINATPLDPRIALTEDPLVVCADGYTIDIRSISELYLKTLQESEELVAKICYGCDSDVSIANFTDSFFKSSIQSKILDLDKKLLEHVLVNKSIRADAVAHIGNGKVVFKEEFWARLRHDVDELDKRLLLLLYLGGGMPP